MKRRTKCVTTKAHELRIPAEEIIDLVHGETPGDEEVPIGAVLVIEIPGGGDYSSEDFEPDEILIRWTTKQESEE